MPKPKRTPNPVGRPKPTESKEGAPIFVRCTAAERARYEHQAEKEGFRSFSDWIRITLNKASPP